MKTWKWSNKFVLWGIILVFTAFLMSACGGGEATSEENIEPEALQESASVAGSTTSLDEETPEENVQEAETPSGWLGYFTAGGSFQPASGRFDSTSGLFSVDVYGEQLADFGELALFLNEENGSFAYVQAFPDWDGSSIDARLEELAEIVPASLLSGGLIDSFTLDLENAEEYEGTYYVPLDFSAAELPEGEGEVVIFPDDEVLIIFVLLAEEYAAVQADWEGFLASYTSGEGLVLAEEPGEPSSDGEDGETAGENDNGFRPEVNGFAFENYGEGYQDLTSIEMVRMFGPQVCASQSAGECILTPPAQEWMEQKNSYMAGGHCEGMAVLSALMYYGAVDPAELGGSSIRDLDLSNEALQREIAYWWTTQGTYPGAATKVDESPVVVLETLQQAFSQGFDASEWWVLGIFKRDRTGGHAITPFAVEDQGDGIYHVLVYDNNYPNETRILTIDANANTWEYEASINPDVVSELYEGDADTQTLEIVALVPRLDEQVCTFCEGTTAQRPGNGMAKQDSGFYEIWLQGKANLLIVDDQGRRTGYDGGEFVNEIPGATTDAYKFTSTFDLDKEPVYRIPVGTTFDIMIDGSVLEAAESSEVSMIGPGYFLSVEDIWLEPGEIDVIGVYVDGARQQLTYQTDYAESPVMTMGMETPQADYAFIVQATDIPGEGDSFDIAIDLAEGDFIINTSLNNNPVTFDFVAIRIDETGAHAFGGSDLIMDPENTMYLNYLERLADGLLMVANFDLENDGQIDESVELEDMGAEFFADE